VKILKARLSCQAVRLVNQRLADLHSEKVLIGIGLSHPQEKPSASTANIKVKRV